jgi:hypothetical protein
MAKRQPKPKVERSLKVKASFMGKKLHSEYVNEAQDLLNKIVAHERENPGGPSNVSAALNEYSWILRNGEAPDAKLEKTVANIRKMLTKQK